MGRKKRHMDVNNPITQEREDIKQVPAIVLLNKFLQENNIKLKLEVLDQSTPFVGDGFVLVDKPLLKITAEYLN
jgi:hypothetical protein